MKWCTVVRFTLPIWIPQKDQQGGRRPVLIIQNDVGNQYAPTTIVSAITSQEKKHIYPTHVRVRNVDGLEDSSIVMLEQIRTIAKERLEFKMGQLNRRTMWKVNLAILISLGIGDEQRELTNF